MRFTPALYPRADQGVKATLSRDLRELDAHKSAQGYIAGDDTVMVVTLSSKASLALSVFIDPDRSLFKLMTSKWK